MTTVNTDNTALADLGLAVKNSKAKNQSLGQEDFLKLMTAQMQAQDPLKPLDSAQFLGQMAQFSTVSGIQTLNDSFSAMTASLNSNQALQAAGMVGHGVLIPSSEGYLFEGEGMGGAVDVPSSGRVVLEIRDNAGQLVSSQDLGTQPAGLAYFNWNGLDSGGKALPSGNYQISARVQSGKDTVAAPTYAMGLVNSVSLDGSGVTLNLHGLDTAKFSDVRQIF